MSAKVIATFPEQTLGRILAALELELVEAPEAEILEAAADLGMDPFMKGSAAFLGLKYPAIPPRFKDFFATPLGEETQLAVERLMREHLARRKPEQLPVPKDRPRRPARTRKLSKGSKDK